MHLFSPKHGMCPGFHILFDLTAQIFMCLDSKALFCYVVTFKLSCVYCCHLMCICSTVCALLSPPPSPPDTGLLARSQYSEGPATGHLDTGFSWFRCGYKQMLRWFPRFQVATTCFSCSPPDLNLLVTNFMVFIHVK